MRDSRMLMKLIEIAKKADQKVPQSDIVLKIVLQAQASVVVLDKGPVGQGCVGMAEAFRRSVLESMRRE